MSSKFLAALASGVLLPLPFLFPSLFPIAWVSLIPLFWLLQQSRSLRQAFLFGWLMGGVTYLIGFYWLNYTISVFGGFSYGLSGLIFLLFAASAALPLALFSLLVRLCGAGPLNLFPAFFWVAIEFCSPLLFPWHLANTQSQFLTLIQSADLVGPYGTSFLLVWLNATTYDVIFSRDRRGPVRAVAIFSAVLVGTLLYGHFRLKGVEAEMRRSPALSLAAVQGSIDIRHKWSQAYLESNLQSYQELTRKIHGVKLVVWPESAVEAWLPEGLRRLPPELLPSLPRDGSFIFGARSYRGNPTAPDLKAFNSAFLTDAEGRVLGHYHKQVLLAFGEYIPFAAILSNLPGFPPIGAGFTPGEGPTTLDLPAGIKVAPLICYEDLMPALARRLVAEKGAHLLINLTNDAWFGASVAPWQHARLAQWRAIETRRTLVRVTNTGVTALISPKGEILQSLPTFAPGVLVVNAWVMEGKTLYVRLGDWFGWTITLFALGLVLRRWRSGKLIGE